MICLPTSSPLPSVWLNVLIHALSGTERLLVSAFLHGARYGALLDAHHGVLGARQSAPFTFVLALTARQSRGGGCLYKPSEFHLSLFSFILYI